MFVWKYTALGESVMTNIALSFACAIVATRLSPWAVYFIQTGGSTLSNTYNAISTSNRITRIKIKLQPNHKSTNKLNKGVKKL